jgi:hypothetical protein
MKKRVDEAIPKIIEFVVGQKVQYRTMLEKIFEKFQPISRKQLQAMFNDYFEFKMVFNSKVVRY